MKSTKSLKSLGIEKSSGNVYEDLGFPDHVSLQVKSELVMKISDLIEASGLTQTEAAKKLGLTQPKLSSLLRGQFRGVSERRLLDCLIQLGQDVQIVVKPSPRSRPTGRLTLSFS